MWFLHLGLLSPRALLGDSGVDRRAVWDPCVRMPSWRGRWDLFLLLSFLQRAGYVKRMEPNCFFCPSYIASFYYISDVSLSHTQRH